MADPLQIYLAAVYTNSYMPGGNRYPKLNEQEISVMETVKKHNILESYHYVNRPSFVRNMRDNGAKVFLDSGAFSAWKGGVEIDINEYCNYILRCQDIIRVEDNNLMASVLDCVGNAQGTFENQMTMERLGVRPLPCFHKYEDTRYLDWYVANYDYITIGGMVGTPSNVLIKWLDTIWEKHMIDGAGRPKVKVHGFGLTAVPVMERYPWYSCDSSSWIQNASFGGVFTVDHGAMPVSEHSPARHTENQHVTTLTDIEREYMLNYIAERGFDVERLATIYESRAVFNLKSYMDLQHKVNAERACHQHNFNRGLFD